MTTQTPVDALAEALWRDEPYGGYSKDDLRTLARASAKAALEEAADELMNGHQADKPRDVRYGASGWLYDRAATYTTQDNPE